MQLIKRKTLGAMELREVYEWLYEHDIDILRLGRQLSDVYLLAKMLQNYYPRQINLVNYPKRNCISLKTENWQTFNSNVLWKFNMAFGKGFVDDLVKGTYGTAEVLVHEFLCLMKTTVKRQMAGSLNRKKVDKTLVQNQIDKTMGKQVGETMVQNKNTLLPNQKKTLASNKEKTVIPNQQKTISANQEKTAIPNEKKSISTNQEKTAIPNQQKTISTNQEKTAIPNQKQTISPNQKKTVAPKKENTVSLNQKKSISRNQSKTVVQKTTKNQEVQTVELNQDVDKRVAHIGNDIKMILYAHYEDIARECQAKDVIIEEYERRLIEGMTTKPSFVNHTLDVDSSWI